MIRKFLIAFFSVLLCLAMAGPGWSATITRYINTASSGGNGTTNELSGANAAYASMSAFQTAEATNLTDNGGDVMLVYAEGTAADTTAVTLSGWTTSVTSYLDIRGNNTSGKYNTSKYRIVAANWGGGALTNNGTFFLRLTGIQAKNTDTHTDSGTDGFRQFGLDGQFGTTGDGDIRIDKCFFISAGNAGATVGVGDWFDTIRVTNSVAIGPLFGFKTNGSYGVSTGILMYNDIGVALGSGTAYGIYSSDYNITVKNSYAAAPNKTGGSAFSTNLLLTTSASDDGSRSTTTAAYSTSSGAYFTNVTPGSEDFHIGASSSLKDAGTDLSSVFNTDIDGDTIGTWPIGVDYIVAGSSPFSASSVILKNIYFKNAIIP